MNLAQKILKAHLVHGELIPGTDICISIDQTLMQDATGTMAMAGIQVKFPGVRERLTRGDVEIPVDIGDKKMITLLEVSERQRFYLLAGAALNFVRESLKK